MDRRCYFLKITGAVQGVLFRDFVRRRAEALKLKGYVKNCDDGSVEIVINDKDNDKAVNEFLFWVKKGPLLARVDSVDINEIPCEEEFLEFSMK